MNDGRHLEAILRIRCGISYSLVIGDRRNEEGVKDNERDEKKTATQITSKWTEIESEGGNMEERFEKENVVFFFFSFLFFFLLLISFKKEYLATFEKL